MRATTRLLARVKPGRFLEPGNPTGLTGLFTHPSPRSTLIATYGATLDKLKKLPEHSVYRQSAEAITRHRLNIIESVKPEGYDAWAQRMAEKIEADPDIFSSLGRNASVTEIHGGTMISTVIPEEEDDREIEWDGEPIQNTLEGVRTPDERASQKLLAQDGPLLGKETITLEPEPPLEATQYVQNSSPQESSVKLRTLISYRIHDVETQIGGGLIEEVIQVAEGELKLVDTMTQSKVLVHSVFAPVIAFERKPLTFCRWEELEEKAPEGQWEYFSRDQHTLPTQEPPVDKKY